jgi:hypothetical protein
LGFASRCYADPIFPLLARIADHPINLAGDLLRKMNGARRRASASSTAQAAQRGACFLHPTGQGKRIEKTMLRDLGACAFSHDLGAKPEAADPEQSFRSAPTAAIRLMIFRRLISTEAVEKASTLSRPLPPAGHDSVVLSHTGL